MLTATDFLHEMLSRGATRVARVRFRDNRSTVWSLTQRGTVLNVHSAFRTAPSELLEAFATVASQGGVGSAASRRAAETIREWPVLAEAIDDARRRHTAEWRAGTRSAHCCGTADQRAYLRAVYRYFNQTRFAGALPGDLPVRLSNRMTTALGHMRPGASDEDDRYVAEIALNVDLLLAGNGGERVDTLLHEMAHAADYLASGHRGHGPSWQAWARRVGCRPQTLHDRPVRYRRRRRDPVTRVPPLPAPLLEL